MSLAVKYRPKKWKDIVGHDVEVLRLKGLVKQFEKKKKTNALFFAGPSGLGKTTLARLFANYVNCEKNDLCGECEWCTNGDNSDIVEINAANTRGIDDVRALTEAIRFKPKVGKYKIIILDEVQQLTTQASQALMKTLEEPPKHVIFILCSMQPDKVEEAVIGRCSFFNLQRPSKEQITERLKYISKKEDKKVSSKIIDIISESSHGGIRFAIQKLEAVFQVIESGDKKSEKELEEHITNSILSSGNESDSNMAIQTLVAIFKRKPKEVHKAILGVSDHVAFINTLSYLCMYFVDRTLIGFERNRNVWHTADNKKMYSTVEKELGSENLKSNIEFAFQVLDEINNVKFKMGSFMANNRHLLTATFMKLASKK